MLNFLSEDRVFLNLEASSKKQILLALAAELSKLTNLEERDIFDALADREKIGSTGVGDGVAIPHCKFNTCDDLYGIVVRLDEGIDFDAVDDEPVDIFVCLLAPEQNHAEHLKTLAKISRILRDEKNLTAVRAAEDAKQMIRVFQDATGQSNAA